MIIVSFFVPPPTDEEIEKQKKEDAEYEQQRRAVTNWNSYDKPTQYEEPEKRKDPEPESETHAQKFRRENTMRECVRRGGYLTTGERMEAMYGACEEAAQCFPDEYYR